MECESLNILSTAVLVLDDVVVFVVSCAAAVDDDLDSLDSVGD